jgi:predicted ABC-type sugar transport system permease subunit
MIGKFLTTPIGSMGRIVVGVVLGYLVLDLSNDGTISVSWDELMTWVAAGLVVGVPVLIAFVNPADTRFGRTAPPE